MNGKREILAAIRAKTSDRATEPDRAFAVRERLAKPPAGIVPSQPRTAAQRIEQFVSKASSAAASVSVVSRKAAGESICQWLVGHNLPPRLRLGCDPLLAGIRWPAGIEPELLHGPSDGTDLTGLSHALIGISETGTLVLASGRENPTTINFLPQNHIVLINGTDIVASQEAAWHRLRRIYGRQNLPRTVNLITGPSRSADIEQTLILGAHGPVRLHVIVLRR